MIVFKDIFTAARRVFLLLLNFVVLIFIIFLILSDIFHDGLI